MSTASFSYEAPIVDGPPATTMATTSITGQGTSRMVETGAGDSTNMIMMMVVLAGYSFMFTVMLMACFRTRRPAGFQQFDVEEGPPAQQRNVKVSEMDAIWRNKFIAKVYSIMGIQMFVTVVIVFSMMQFGGADLARWILTTGSWASSVSFVSVFISLIALMCYRTRYPHNLIILALFTCSMSYMIGTTCTFYAASGLSGLVLEAFAITSLIFVALTVFTIQSKIDFSFLGLGLSVALVGFLVWGLFAMIAFPSFYFSQIYALFGALLFAGYVVYDTWLITQALSYDEYILGAVNLYLDFINLFLFILRCLTGGGRD